MSKGGAPCPPFKNGKCRLPFWSPEGGTLSFSEHLNIEKHIHMYYNLFDISVRFLLSFDYKAFKLCKMCALLIVGYK